jgi:hypothetical protein
MMSNNRSASPYARAGWLPIVPFPPPPTLSSAPTEYPLARASGTRASPAPFVSAYASASPCRQSRYWRRGTRREQQEGDLCCVVRQSVHHAGGQANVTCAFDGTFVTRPDVVCLLSKMR